MLAFSFEAQTQRVNEMCLQFFLSSIIFTLILHNQTSVGLRKPSCRKLLIEYPMQLLSFLD
jgi:hypothetical protein